MMDTSLKLYFFDGQQDMAFPYGMEQAELHDFTVNKTRMGSAPTITATLEYPVCLDDEWAKWCQVDDVYVVFNGERYYLKATPASSKDNTKATYKHELSFVSERSVLETTYMIDDLENRTQNILLSNNTKITFFGTLAEFVERINQSMYFSGIGDTCVYNNGQIVPIGSRTPVGDGFYIVIDGTVTNTDEVLVTLSDNTVSDALKQLFEKWGVPYYFDGRLIHVGDYQAVVETVPTYADSNGVLGAGIDNGALVPYEYGAPNSVLQVSRSNSTKQIYNRCSGTGSEDNIPYYYPNPTPSGTIHHETTAQTGSTLDDSDITVTNPLKFSNLGVDDALVYTQGNNSVSVPIRTQYIYATYNGEEYPMVSYANDSYYGIGFVVDFPYDDFQQGGIAYYGVYIHIRIEFDLLGDYDMIVINFGSEFATAVPWTLERPDGVIITGRGRYCNVTRPRLLNADGDFVNGRYKLHMEKVFDPASPSDAHGYFDLAGLVADMKAGSGTSQDPYLWLASQSSTIKYWALQSNGKKVNLSDYGLTIASGVTLVEGDKIEKVVDKWVNPQEKLMPACYRLSGGREKFYPARNYPFAATGYTPNAFIGEEVVSGNVENGNYKDDGNQYYDFPNPLRKLKQKEHIYDFPDIKPSIVGMTNEDDLRIDMFEAFAYDDNDDNSGYFDDNGNWNYNHPYFFAKMRPTDTFNLFDHAIDEAKMTIAFTSGNCAPCEFEIAVDKKTQMNLVQVDDITGLPAKDEYGDVICGRKADVAPQTGSQQETQYTWTWIALKKDTSTYGENNIMPFYDGNVEIRPTPCSDFANDGDTFVILHIEMPQAYIEAAEQRLTEEIIRQMRKDNGENFNQSLKYDRVYLGDNQDLIGVLSENVKVSTRYNNKTSLFFVSSYTYAMKSNSPIPEISIGGLVETIEELKSVASAGGSFIKKVGEHIAENFGELMLGAGKPLTRIIQQNNTQVVNRTKGEFPTDYVRTKDDLPVDYLVLGNGGNVVKKMPQGKDGQFLLLEGLVPKWKDIEIPETGGETTALQSDFTIPSSATEVQGLRTALTDGVYLVNLVLSIKKADVQRNGVVTCFMTYNKSEICSTQAYITGDGQLCLSTVVEVNSDDKEKIVKVFAFSESSMNNVYYVASSVTNESATHYNSSLLTFARLK